MLEDWDNHQRSLKRATLFEEAEEIFAQVVRSGVERADLFKLFLCENDPATGRRLYTHASVPLFSGTTSSFQPSASGSVKIGAAEVEEERRPLRTRNSVFAKREGEKQATVGTSTGGAAP